MLEKTTTVFRVEHSTLKLDGHHIGPYRHSRLYSRTKDAAKLEVRRELDELVSFLIPETETEMQETGYRKSHPSWSEETWFHGGEHPSWSIACENTVGTPVEAYSSSDVIADKLETCVSAFYDLGQLLDWFDWPERQLLRNAGFALKEYEVPFSALYAGKKQIAVERSALELMYVSLI